MSGISTVLPVVDAALAAPAISKAVNPKMGTQPARMGSQDPGAAADGKANASKGKDPMETNFLGGCVRAVDHGKADEANAGGGVNDATGVDFNEVLNKRINHKAGKSAQMETDGVAEKEMTPAEEFAINPFVHVTAASEQVDAAGGPMRGNPESSLPQGSGGQAAGQAQASGPVQVPAEGLDLTGQTGETGEKNVLPQTQGDISEKTSEGVVSENPVAKQNTGEVVELPVEGKEAVIGAQSHKGVASEQGVVTGEKNGVMAKEGASVEPVEIAASAAGDRAGKDAAGSVTAENTGKEIKGLVEDNKSLESVGPAKGPAVQQTDTFKQSMQNQGQEAGQSGSGDAGNRGLGLENADIQVEKTVKGKASTFEMPDIDAAKSDPGVIGQPFDTVEQGSQVSSVSATQISAKVSGDMMAPGAMKPIDQIIQQLNVVDSTVSNQQIRMTLTPEDLGTIRITFRQMEGEMVGMVEVQKDQTRREVEEAMPQLITAMQENGLQVRKIEVLQWNNPDQQASKDASEQGFSLAQEREFAQQNSRGSSDSSGFEQGGGQRQGSRRGPIRLEELAHSDRVQSQKGLDFLV